MIWTLTGSESGFGFLADPDSMSMDPKHCLEVWLAGSNETLAAGHVYTKLLVSYTQKVTKITKMKRKDLVKKFPF